MSQDGLGPLGKHVAHQLDEIAVRTESSEAMRRLLEARVASSKQGTAIRGGARVSPVWRLAALAVSTAAIGLLGGLWLARSSSPEPRLLSFTVGESARPGRVGAWERAPAHEELPFVFSDGTRVEFSGDSRGRVVRLGAHGAEVVLDSGTALVDVVPAVDSAWLVQSGPFVIEVRGTKFEVSWDPARDDFRLRLHEGRVHVSGCSIGAGQVLERGQQLRAACSRRRFVIAALDDELPSLAATEWSGDETAHTEAPNTQSVRVEAPDARAASSSQALHGPGPTPPNSWRALARAGHFERAYAAAAEAGYDEELAGANSSDALLLGDVARLSGHGGPARSAYRKVRERFVGDAAARAAFAMGRLTAGTAESLRWFETYLNEQPRGPLAPAALDRLLETSVQLGDRSRARTIARRYVNEYPRGPHAEQARKLLEGDVGDGG